MQILITNHHLALLGGTETATYTLALALREAGHGVALATVETGAVSSALVSEGFEVATDLRAWAGRRFDVIHAHHNAMALVARHHFPATPMIFVGHGIIPPLEQPPSVPLGIAVFVAVSEEVRRSWADKYGIENAEVVMNAVDCERFSPAEPIRPRLERVLVLSNHFPPDLRTLVGDACSRIGANLRFAGLENGAVWDTERLINSADLVVSLGRGVVEAAACGRAVLILDRHGCDGLLTPESYPEVRVNNFSGRRYARRFDLDSLLTELARYSPAMGEANRDLALQHHDIRDAAETYLSLYRRAVDVGPPRGVPPIPVEEIEHFQRLWRDHVALKAGAVRLMNEHQRVRAELDALKPNLRSMMRRLELEKKRLGRGN